MVSGGGRLSIYDTKRNYRIAKWASKECVRKLLYNSSKDVVMATTASSVHLFSDREISDDLNPLLSQPHADTFTQVVLVGVSEGGNEAHLWYSAESKLKALRISAQGITSETFRLYANSTIEHMEALGGTGEGRLKDVVLSHRGCVEKWDVAKQERSAVCDCYDLCSHLCMENCKFCGGDMETCVSVGMLAQNMYTSSHDIHTCSRPCSRPWYTYMFQAMAYIHVPGYGIHTCSRLWHTYMFQAMFQAMTYIHVPGHVPGHDIHTCSRPCSRPWYTYMFQAMAYIHVPGYGIHTCSRLWHTYMFQAMFQAMTYIHVPGHGLHTCSRP